MGLGNLSTGLLQSAHSVPLAHSTEGNVDCW